MNHDQFLQRLLDAFPGNVFLVGQYADPALDVDDGALRVFVPDLHWMSKATLLRFSKGYEFNQGRLPDGRPLFGTLLDVLEDCKQALANGLEVFQLGDSFDLWREVRDANEPVLEAYERVRNDPLVKPLADRLVALKTSFVRGNHDAWLKGINHGLTSADQFTTAAERVVLVHGHRFDNVEVVLPDTVQLLFVQLATAVKPGKKRIGGFRKTDIARIDKLNDLRRKPSFPPTIYPTVDPRGALPLEKTADVADLLTRWQFHVKVDGFKHGTGSENDFEHVDHLTFGDDIFRLEAASFSDHTLYVIGHTHHARILVDRSPMGAKPLVTMDCGAWVEWCYVRQTEATDPPRAVPSGQVGVQTGNEIRIYQLGGAV